MKTIILFIFLCFISVFAFSQVAINISGDNPDASAGLDVSFTNKGVLIPRVALTSATDNTTISSPATSLLVYNTGTGGLSPAGYYYWNGSQWVQFGAISGSCGTVNMLPKMASSTSITCSQIFDDGTNVGIGTTSPSYKLDVTGVIRSNNEIISTLGGSGQFRAIAGNYGAFIRNDGNDTYIPLLTASGDQYGSWNTLRPLRVNNATGDVFLANNSIIAQHSTGFLGVGTTSPSQRLHVVGNVQFSGALMPNGNAGSSGQLLVSQGSATPPAWQSISSLPFYGNNMSSVKLTTYATNNNTSAWTDLLTLNVTPVHNTIYIFASLGTRLEDNSGNAQYGQAIVKARILVNSVEVARTASVITDYDDFKGVVTSGSVSFSGIPVSVTPGVNTTIKLQWQPSILWATSPWRLGIDPNSTTVGDHAVLTVFD